MTTSATHEGSLRLSTAATEAAVYPSDLGAEVVGQVGFNDDQGPVVLPSTIEFTRVTWSSHGTVDQHCPVAIGTVVAVLIEQLDPLTTVGLDGPGARPGVHPAAP